VFFTYSRGATLVLAGYLVLAAATYLLIPPALLSPFYHFPPRLAYAHRACCSVRWDSAASQLNYQQAERTFTSLFVRQEKDLSVAHRLEAYQASESMLSDHWQRGVGAGGFRYLFPNTSNIIPTVIETGSFSGNTPTVTGCSCPSKWASAERRLCF
jgi:hypothetical protein